MKYHTKRKNIWMISAIVALGLTTVLFVTLMAVYLVQRNNYRTQLENAYQKSYYELVSNVNQMEVRLSKLMIASGVAQRRILLREIVGYAQEAENNLGTIPADQQSISGVSSFLNRVNGYSGFLLRRIDEETELAETYSADIVKLHRACKIVADELYTMTERIGGGYYFTDNHARGAKFDNPLNEMLSGMDEKSTDYPQLIFDGPFSDALLARELKGLTGEEISSAEGEARIRAAFSDAAEVRFDGECKAKELDLLCYQVAAKSGRKIYLQLSKIGGKLVMLDSYRKSGEAVLSREEAVHLGEKFAEKMGFSDMKAVWYCADHGIATVNLAPVQDNVILYPDLVKVKVALEDGEILGLEALHYYYNHCERNIQIPSADTAKVKREISEKLDLMGERLAVIPYANEERLAFEIAGEFDGLSYFVYLDAMTGREINVFRVVDTEQGQLLI